MGRQAKHAPPHREGLQRCQSATYGLVMLTACPANTSDFGSSHVRKHSDLTVSAYASASSGRTAGHAPTSRFRLTAWPRFTLTAGPAGDRQLGQDFGLNVACWQKTSAFGGSHTRKHSDVTLLAYSEANLAMISACSVASRQNTSVFGSSHMRKHSDPAGSAGASAS